MSPVPPSAPPVEKQVAFDMVRRALPFVPVVIAVSWLAAGSAGAWSAVIAIVVVLANLVLSALALGWAAKVSLNAIMAVALGGFLARMLLVTAVVYAVKDQPWVNLTALAILILVTHLGLLFWETRYVSASLAFPGLTPRKKEVGLP